MQVFKKLTNKQDLSILKEIPNALTVDQGKPGISHFKNGKKCHIGCLRCKNPRCIFFSKDEIECDQINGFPNDKNTSTCPVGAITWDDALGIPLVDSRKCINCGICASRCPVGALYFSKSGKLLLNATQEDSVELKNADITTQKKHFQQIEELLKKNRIGTLLNASDRLFEKIYEKLSKIKSNNHNIVGRNLLIALGCKCATRRIGDVYTRMDAIYSSSGGSFGAVEIEFGRDTLDASRGVLDDIAVLNTRYGIKKQNNRPLVICLQLPNIRQGYWQVIRDVKIVEGIKIETITIGALMYLLWNGCIFKPEDDQYYIDYDNMDLRRILCTQTKCKDISISKKKLGIMEPMK